MERFQIDYMRLDGMEVRPSPSRSDAILPSISPPPPPSRPLRLLLAVQDGPYEDKTSPQTHIYIQYIIYILGSAPFPYLYSLCPILILRGAYVTDYPSREDYQYTV
ncbi:hypothetical protein HanIR_Chr08g0366331 [Helianthus annuus]|nr:hypothetical protein HanIR_Chr08g0366331 [Helianthus annuus]